MLGHATYLVFELSWAVPVLVLQWVVGRRELWSRRRTLAVAIALPTAYLCTADAVAITAGIWIIHTDRTVGLRLGDLPFEEVIFFLVTNTMVVQALALISARGWLAR